MCADTLVCVWPAHLKLALARARVQVVRWYDVCVCGWDVTALVGLARVINDQSLLTRAIGGLGASHV